MVCFPARPLFLFFHPFSPCVLFSHLEPIACKEMLRDRSRRFYRTFSWREAIPAYRLFDIIAFPTWWTMPSTAYSRRALATFSSSIHVSPANVSFRSMLVPSPCILLSSVGVLFAIAATVARFKGTVLHGPSSSIAIFFEEPWTTGNGPVLTDSSLLHDSSARGSAANYLFGVSRGTRTVWDQSFWHIAYSSFVFIFVAVLHRFDCFVCVLPHCR